MITAADLLWDSTAGFQIENDGQSASFDSVQNWRIVVNDPSVDDLFILSNMSAFGVPVLNQARGTVGINRFIFVESTPLRRESPLTWLCTVNFSAGSFNIDPSTGGVDPGNPLLEPTRIRYLTRKEDLEVDEDIHGDPMVTANNEPITGIKRSFRDLGVVLEKNFPVFDPVLFYTFDGAVSTTPFHGFPAGEAFCDDLSADIVTTTSFSYARVRAVVLFRQPIRTTSERAWWDRVRHEGYLVRPAAGEDPERATDGNGEFTAQKVLLKADGTETDVAEWLEFENVKTADLNAMGFNV